MKSGDGEKASGGAGMENGEVKYIYTYINIYLYIKEEIRFNVSQEEQQKKNNKKGENT